MRFGAVGRDARLVVRHRVFVQLPCTCTDCVGVTQPVIIALCRCSTSLTEIFTVRSVEKSNGGCSRKAGLRISSCLSVVCYRPAHHTTLLFRRADPVASRIGLVIPQFSLPLSGSTTQSWRLSQQSRQNVPFGTRSRDNYPVKRRRRRANSCSGPGSWNLRAWLPERRSLATWSVWPLGASGR